MAAQRGLLIRDELNKLQHIHTIKYCTAFKRGSKAVLYVSVREKLKEIVSEKRKLKKKKVCSLCYYLYKRSLHTHTHTHLRTILKMC